MTAVEDAWRDEWGRLLALLVARYRRLDLAEDGLGDAFEVAARTWPHDGTPTNPAGWLLTAARNRILDRLRAEAVHARTGHATSGRRTTSGCGSCSCARTRRWPPRRPPR